MFLGKVVGSVWSTKKTDNLTNLKFLVINPINLKAKPLTDVVIAADVLGAGVGETVICAYGHAARQAICPADPKSLSIEAAVVAIVDRMDIEDEQMQNITDKKKIVKIKRK
ncbi:MAG: EutN/CcmL family microcompartment protein [Calditrichaceae bacterium]|nr:EutN/CcmL family microcompartment protein [Calditrichaceae bacterium]